MKTRSKITLLLFALSLLAGALFGCAPGAQSGTAPQLTQQEAQDIALDHAGLTTDQVSGMHTTYELDDGTPEYEIEFRHDDTEYDYTVHAETGAILSWDKEREPTTTTAPTTAPTEPATLTVQEAEDIALAKAGLSRDRLDWIRTVYPDGDDMSYEIEFLHGEQVYDCSIHIHTGEILDWEQEPLTEDASTGEPVTPTGIITYAQAEDSALSHAGLTRDQVTRLHTGYDLDDEDPTFEVEFHHDGWEYDYEIHRHTGEVIRWSKEKD